MERQTKATLHQSYGLFVCYTLPQVLIRPLEYIAFVISAWKILTQKMTIYHKNLYMVYLFNGKTSAYSMVFCKVFSIVLNNNEKQTLWDEDIGPFQRRRTYRVETRGQDAILSYWFNTDEIAGGLFGRSCGGAPCSSRLLRRHVEFIK